MLLHILRIEIFWQLAVSKFKPIDLKHQRSKSFIYSIFKPGSHNAGELPVILLPMSVGDICEQKAFTSAVRKCIFSRQGMRVASVLSIQTCYQVYKVLSSI